MCKISGLSKDFRDGEEGDQVLVSIGRYGYGIAGFHKPYVSLEDCSMCYKDGAVMNFSNIPTDVQINYGIEETETVRFHETPGSEIEYVQDEVAIISRPGLVIPLNVFADINVSVNVITIPVACEEDLALAA